MDPDETSLELTPEAEEKIRALLADEPRPMIPGEVSARVQAAIVSELRIRSGAGVEAVSAPKSLSRRMMPFAAAAAVVLFGFLVWPTFGEPNTADTLAAKPTCTVSAEPETDISEVLVATGANYAPGSLSSTAEVATERSSGFCRSDAPTTAVAPQEAVPRGAVPQGAVPQGAVPKGALPEEEGAELGTADKSAARPSVPSDGQGGEMQSAMSLVLPAGGGEPALRRCVVDVLEGRRIELVDVAAFNGHPAIIVVLSSPREVMAVDCRTSFPSVIAQAELSGN